MAAIPVLAFGSNFSANHLLSHQKEECSLFAPTYSGEDGPAIGAALEKLGLWAPGEGFLPLAAEDVAVVYGSSKGNLRQLETIPSLGPVPDITKDWAPIWPQSYALEVASYLDARGPALSPVAACATGSHAVALGAQLIEDGRARLVVCGAKENALLPAMLGCYRRMGALSPSGMIRPFDRRRDGFVPAQGAGFVVLAAADLVGRLATAPLAMLTGWSMLCDASHMTGMDHGGRGVAAVVRGALRRAGRKTVDYVNAHGTGTVLNDDAETRGLHLSLGDGVPCSSTKPLTGHLLGAAGAVEAAICLQTLTCGTVPPTLNLEEPDTACDLDYIPLSKRRLDPQSCISLNYGFGGHMGALLLERA